MAGSGGGGQGRSARVLISYAHDDQGHEERVRGLWVFLRACGIDARLDLAAAADRVDWAAWMTREVRDADRVLVVASPAYKRRAEGDAGPGEGRGVQWEARLIRDLFYADQDAGIRRFVPVVLPGCSERDIPSWLAPASAAFYRVTEFTVAGAEDLLRVLTGQPRVLVPDLGEVPPLPPLASGSPAAAGPAGRPGVHTEVVIEAGLAAGGVVTSAVWAAGSLVGRYRGPLPPEVTGVWGALRLPGVVAGERLAAAGRALAGALLSPDAQGVVAGLLEHMTAQDTAEVVLCADREALALPVELLRLRTAGGGEVGPLGLLPAVAVSRHPQAPRAEAAQDSAAAAAVAAGGAGRAVEGAGGGGRAGGDRDGEPAARCRGGDGRGAGRGGRDRRRGAGPDPGGRLTGGDPAGAGPGRLSRAAPVGARVRGGGGAGGRGRQPGHGGAGRAGAGTAAGRAGGAADRAGLVLGRRGRVRGAGGGPGGAGRGPGDRDARPGHRRLRHDAGRAAVPAAGRPPGADRRARAGPGPGTG